MSESRPRSPVQNRIGVVFIPASDMAQARAWYGRLFGIELGEPSHDGGICDIPMAGDAGLLLDANRPVTEHSVQPLCFLWRDDMPATRAHLRTLDAEIDSDVTDIGSVSSVRFGDPDGNLLMVCERNYPPRWPSATQASAAYHSSRFRRDMNP